MNDPHEPPFGSDLVRHYLGDLIYGANDGIITTFAVVSGVEGGALDARVVLVLGIANLLADGVSMGASNFLAIRSAEAGRAASGLDEVEPYPNRHAIATFLAFVLAGAVPLVPYVVAPPGRRFLTAIVATLLTLFVVGALRSLVTELRFWRAGLEMLVVGAAAAAIAYGVGALVAGLV